MARVFTITEGLENMGALRTGGQGSVYKARRTGTIITAVKLLPTPIHSENTTDKHYTDFMNEVQKLKKVNEIPNPNVVKILSSGITETGSLPFIEMEFIEGPDLEELLLPPHDPVFTIKDTIKVAEQLSNALAHCHRVDIKHGDIKSNNVKFNIHTGNYVLLDFGLAAMSDEQRRTSLRHAGAVEFMAPEQNDGQMLFQSDVYGFGVILFELLAGQVPFPLKEGGETARNLVRIAHMEAPVPDLMALRKQHLPEHWSADRKEHEMQVPQWLISLILKCLQKRPESRFANGIALHDFIVRSSIHASIKKEESVDLVEKLQQENRRLQGEKEGLEKQLAVYKKQGHYSERPKKSSTGRSGLIAFILTALVVAALIYIGLKSNDKGLQKTNKPANTSQQEKPRKVIEQYKVVAPRAFFYNSPDPGTRRNAFMIPSNDVIGALDEKNDFIYVEFTNDNGQTSKGWLRKQDLMTLGEWTRNQESQAKLNEQDVQGQLREARHLLTANKIKEALYIYSFLSDQGVPEAMYEYGNLTLQNKNDAISCEEALNLVKKASDQDYIPAKRTLGFLYIFAENKDVLQVSNYDRCNYDKNVYKGTQLLLEAALRGDSTAKRLVDEINAKRSDNQPPTQQ